MTDSRKPHIRLLDDAKAARDKEKAKAEAYRQRAESKHNFYVQARINKEIIEILKTALKDSVVLDDEGSVLLEWTDEQIEALIIDVKDPGSTHKNRDK